MDGGNLKRAGAEWGARTNARVAAWRGAIETPLLPSLVLFATFLGFGALARQTGLSLFNALFASVFIFALPAMVVLIDQMAHGASMFTAALAVTATAVRLLPLVMAIVPLIRHRNVPRWVEYFIAYFTAVTMWVEALRRAPTVPKHLRAAYAVGIAVNLVLSAVTGAFLGYVVATGTPAVITAALLFLSPIYFMVAMLAGTRDTLGLMPIVIGLVLGPLFYFIAPKFDLLLTGVVGGTLSFWAAKIFFKARSGAIKSQHPAIDARTVAAPPGQSVSLNGLDTMLAPVFATITPHQFMAAQKDIIAWQSFMGHPAGYADSGRLAACFSDSLDAGFGNTLLANGRLQARLSTLITIHYGLPAWIGPEQCDELDRTIALLPVERLQPIIRRAGAIHWSPVIATAIRTHDVKKLHQEIGEDECAHAITSRDLANHDLPPVPLEELSGKVAEDGLRCFAAWCDAQPHGIGARVRLKLPASPILDETSPSPIDNRGAAIVRAAASQLLNTQ